MDIVQDRPVDKPRGSRPVFPRLSRFSLRLRLILLVLASVLPVTAFSLVDGYLDYRLSIERVGRERQLLARALAIAVDSELQRAIAAMQVLAQSRRLVEGDMEGFRRRANDVINEQFPGANILLLRPDGQQLMNTALAPGEPLPRRRDLTTLRQALETGQPVVSDLFYGLVVRRQVIAIDVPVRDTRGELSGVVSINPPASAFADLVARHRPPGQWEVTVLDRQGLIVARSPDSQRHVGLRADAKLLAAVQSQRSGALELTARDGAAMLTVFTRGETIGWTVAIGIPRSELSEPAIALALRTLAIGGAFLALGLVLAVVLARRIAAPIGALRMIATEAGGDAVLPPSPTGLRETDEVAAALRASRDQRQRSDRRYRALFDAHPHAMAVYDLATIRLLEVNDAAVRVYGWSREEMLSKTMYDICAPEELPRLRELHGKEILDFYAMRHRRKDGTVFDAESVVRVIELDGKRVGLALSQDVTDRNLTRARLVEAVEAFPGSFRLYDRNERLVLTNGKSWATPESGLNATVGQDFESTVRAVAKVGADSGAIGREDEWVAGRLAQFRRGQTDAEVRMRDGRWYQLIERRTADGGTISLRIDITQRKQIEAQLQQSQKMETLGQLAGGLAHDFNNCLAVIMASFEDIIEVELEGTDAHASAETGLKATEQAAALTNRLLAFSRRQELEPVKLDIAAVVRDLHKMLRSAVPPEIELAVNVPAAPGYALLDRTQLETAVMNLVVNARDAIGERGMIGLEVEHRAIGQDDLASSPGARVGDWIFVSVSDDGAGMSAETQARIFEPFFTTKAVGKGTGLGLSQVHGFVAQSSGFVTVCSAPKAGTRFSLHFPAVR